MHCNLQSPKSLLYGKLSGSQMQLSMNLLHVSTALLQQKVTIKNLKILKKMQKFNQLVSLLQEFISKSWSILMSKMIYFEKRGFWELVKQVLVSLVLRRLRLAVVAGDHSHQGGVQASMFLTALVSSSSFFPALFFV